MNQGLPKDKPVAIGRYPEDVYYDGNPWYLTTYAVAEQLYDAIYQWKRIGKIQVDDVSLGFFKQIYPAVTKNLYESGSEQFEDIVNAVKSYADGFFEVTVSFKVNWQLYFFTTLANNYS